MNKKGFTLIEFLIYTAIVTFVIGALTLTAVNALNARVRVTAMERVINSAETAMDSITYAVQNAREVNEAGSNLLELEVDPTHENPTIFTVSNGTLMVTKGSEDPVPVTGSNVEVTSLSFSNPSERMVEIDMTIEHNNPQGLLSYEYSGTFTTKENIRFLQDTTPETIVYIYNQGSFEDQWTEGYSNGSGSQSKESDYLYLEASDAASEAERTYVTNSTIDLTDYSSLRVEWENNISASASAESWAVVSTEQMSDSSVNDAYVKEDGLFASKISQVDISELNGEYYIRIHSGDGSAVDSQNSELYVYKVRLE